MPQHLPRGVFDANWASLGGDQLEAPLLCLEPLRFAVLEAVPPDLERAASVNAIDSAEPNEVAKMCILEARVLLPRSKSAVWLASASRGKPEKGDPHARAIRRDSGAARSHSPRMEAFVLLAWFTGHRSASIRQLRWSDIDFEAGTIHWRGELDKIEYDHKNPLHSDAIGALKQERTRSSSIGDAWIFPSARTPQRPLSGDAVFNLWKRFAKAAGIPSGQRYGWHSFRRAFANTLRNVPLRDLKDLGDWKTERTVVSVYQQPSQDAQRVALTTLVVPSERAQGTGT